MKRRYLYSFHFRATILGGLLFYMCIIVWMSIKFWNNYIAVPKENREWGIMLLPCFFTVGLIAFVWYCRGLIRKMLLRYTINETGIFCSGLSWKKFCLQWEEIQTYGVAQYTFCYQMVVVYFWRQKGYIADAKSFRMAINKVSRNHIAFQYTSDLLMLIQRYAPEEIAHNIQVALEKGISVHHQKKCSTRGSLYEHNYDEDFR